MEVYFNIMKGKAQFDHLHDGLFTLWMIKHSFLFDIWWNSIQIVASSPGSIPLFKLALQFLLFDLLLSPEVKLSQGVEPGNNKGCTTFKKYIIHFLLSFHHYNMVQEWI